MGTAHVRPHWFHFELPSFATLGADGWAGCAAMLVALPSAVAYGVATYSIFGPEFAAQGAIAGVVGAAALGLIAPVLGGTPRLISAPCAPAAAMLTAVAAQFAIAPSGRVLTPQDILLLLTLMALSAGALQLIYGLVGAGQLIKYIPFPVISGYLTGVGLLIFLSQLPPFFGFAKTVNLWMGITSPGLWQWPNLVVGCVTIGAVLLAPRITRALPAPIVGLTCGIMTYFGLTQMFPKYFQGNHEHLVIGAVPGGLSTMRVMFAERWTAMGNLTGQEAASLIVPALTLSILLSIDTLKTCVVVDTLTRSRHKSNRELVGQGAANFFSALVGGLPGSGVTGATMVNVNSGAQSKLSSTMEGFFALSVFLLFGRAIGHVPIAALAGILVVVAVRMVDRNSLELLRQKSTLLDFLVIGVVVAVALRFDLIAAAGAGFGLSIVLFIREQIRGSVIRRKLHGDQISSKQHRLPPEKELLRENAALITVCQLQGSLFFGTTDQLFNELENEIKKSRYLILDMTRVYSVDFTAAHMLQQIEAILKDRNGRLIFASLPASLPTGQNLEMYFRQLDVLAPTQPAKTFDSVDEAVEWAEDRVLEELHAKSSPDNQPLELEETDLLGGIDAESAEMIGKCSTRRSYAAGEVVFKMGDSGDELFLIRRGLVRISFQLGDGHRYNVTTFARGDFFGDMAFLDRGMRSADATAITPAELFAISRARLDEIVRDRPLAGSKLFVALARALAVRLRYADSELRALQES